MPVSSFVDPHNRLVISLCVGEVTLGEAEATFAEIRNHPDFHPDFRQLIDLSVATTIPLHFPDLYHLQQVCDPFSNLGRRAVVAPAAVGFGLGRMYQMIVNSPNFEVFRSLSNALTWLEWDGTLLESVTRELLAKKNTSVPPPATVDDSLVEKPSPGIEEVVNRLKKASSA
jgi:hypothetical protein